MKHDNYFCLFAYYPVILYRPVIFIPSSDIYTIQWYLCRHSYARLWNSLSFTPLKINRLDFYSYFCIVASDHYYQPILGTAHIFKSFAPIQVSTQSDVTIASCKRALIWVCCITYYCTVGIGIDKHQTVWTQIRHCRMQCLIKVYIPCCFLNIAAGSKMDLFKQVF